MGRRIKTGDVFEISTNKGLAYGQCTHKIPQWGALICVFPDHFEQRPENFADIVKQSEQFRIFFPLQAAANQQIVEIVANEDIAVDKRDFPLFRAAGFRDKDGNVTSWWLWDGKKEWEIGKKIKEKYKNLPLRQVLNDTALIERIESNWTSEQSI